MHYDVSQFSTLFVAVLLVLVVYRRFRRSFGRQRFSPLRLWIRIGLLSLISLLLLPSLIHSLPLAGSAALGLLLGVGLALYGASRTQFENDGALRYYIPHTYTGILVSALLIIRLAWRMMQTYAAARVPGETNAAMAAYVSNPLTLGLFFVLVGYYVCYYSFLLRRAKRAGPGATALAGPP